MIKKLENFLLVFHDSCEEIYQKKELVKIAVAGRHEKISFIFFEQNVFHQSKWSRTIDLNTTHVVLFKSPCDVQQIDRSLWYKIEQIGVHSRLLSKSYFVFIWSFFDWFRSKDKWIVAVLFLYHRARSYNFLFSSLAKVTALTIEREKRAYTGALAKQKEEVFEIVYCNCSADEVKFLCDCALKIISGIIPYIVDRWLTFEKELKVLCNAAMLRHVARKDDELLPPNKGSNWCRRSVVLSTQSTHKNLF